MRPIQLIMTAFGPYKQKEVIDFEDLGEHRIFAISGIRSWKNNDF